MTFKELAGRHKVALIIAANLLMYCLIGLGQIITITECRTGTYKVPPVEHTSIPGIVKASESNGWIPYGQTIDQEGNTVLIFKRCVDVTLTDWILRRAQ